MYLLKWVRVLPVCVCTAPVFHQGHFIHKSYSRLAFGGVTIFLYQHSQQALLQRGFQHPGTAVYLAAAYQSVQMTKDSPEWVTRSHIWPVHKTQQLALQLLLK